MSEDPATGTWATSEVARELGVSPSLVRTWIAYMSWEVQRNAEGHRVFSDADVDQLRALKAWLDAGNSMKAFRKERQGEGPYDPRAELRNGIRRLREMQTQEDALIGKQREVLDGYLAARAELQTRLEAMKTELDGPMPQAPDNSPVVQGVLKQLLSALLEKQGKLQLVGRMEEGGKTLIGYVTPDGRKQVVEDMCATEADRRMLETVLTIIG